MSSDLIPITAITNPPPKPVATSGSSTLDKDAFLKLLVAQLKYQNPMSPTDPSQFMAQSAQFTMVEKLTDLSDAITQQLATEKNMSAASLLSRTVEWQASDGTRGTGVVKGVRVTADGPELQVGDQQVPLSQVLTVTETPTAPPAAPPAAPATAPTTA